MALLVNELTDFKNDVEKLEKINGQIKQAKIYPTWAVVVFIVSLVLGIRTVAFLIFFYSV